MARSAGIVVENNFYKGLITEASGINFPENACTETYDCVFNIDGSVSRRQGFEFEDNYATKTIARTNNVVSTYLWKNVAGDGDMTVQVVQIGSTLYFYKATGIGLSNGAVTSTVTLTPVSGAPATNTVEAQYCDGNGYLIVTHPYCEPMRIAYTVATDTATATNITIKIRDFEGATADSYAVDERPTATLAALDVSHKYNLYNQGWNTTNLTTWDGAATTMPSNADIMWRFKNSSDAFDMATLANVIAGNTPAPKGHYILTLSNQDRDTASGLTGVAVTTTGSVRPSTSAFFAGRIFYSGINYVGFNSSIYFTQILERLDQYGNAYQVNDPTAEDTYDLLPSDGGVIRIQEAGTIIKLFPVPGGLAVFAANGVWFITGSTGLGFTANDYTVQKIANIATLSATSFVNVAGSPSWWNTDGIYIMSSSSNSMPSIKNITEGTIKDFYIPIPIASKRLARGIFNFITNTVQWIYKSEDTDQVTESYEFDRILNLNVSTGAFYPWIIPSSDIKVNGLTVMESIAGDINLDTVIDGSSNTVVDASTNQVISFSISGVSEDSLTSKFLVSYPDGASHKFTFGEERNEDYVDWYTYDLAGTDYTSYFITGYKLRGEGIRKFQPTWIKIYSKTTEPVSYNFQSIWDYALTGSGTGRWSSEQLVSHSDLNYSNTSRRLKVRGHGVTLQYRVESVAGLPFEILGWISLDTVNQTP